MKVLKLIPKILVSPLLLAIGAVYVIGNFLAAVSSAVTNLVGSFFIFGAACGWIVHAQEAMIWQAAGIGIFLILAPHILQGLLELVLRLMGPLLRIWSW